MSNGIETLRASGLCMGMTEQELSDLLGASELRIHAVNDRIVAEGTPSDCLFLIEEGRVRVEKASPVGAVLIATMGEAGDFFGEMSLIDILPRSADVCAEGPVRLLAFPKRKLAEVFARFPRLQVNLILNIARSLSLRLREADDRIVELSRQVKAGAGAQGR
ncbi:MAG: cyclic nucleotide-binding domain-containing protein [Candidatus Latescibacteria bacterium]|nr:cyclic nucleotide-binding domain-containing protein [Candidatus Latescibacterota bacterium]